MLMELGMFRSGIWVHDFLFVFVCLWLLLGSLKQSDFAQELEAAIIVG